MRLPVNVASAALCLQAYTGLPLQAPPVGDDPTVHRHNPENLCCLCWDFTELAEPVEMPCPHCTHTGTSRCPSHGRALTCPWMLFLMGTRTEGDSWEKRLILSR